MFPSRASIPLDRSVDRSDVHDAVVEGVRNFATSFRARHESQVDDPDGVINIKVHNIFIEALGKDMQYYTALVRSFDSSLGNMLENIAIEIAKISYVVARRVEGPLSIEQITIIAELLESYKARTKKPQVLDYQILREMRADDGETSRHDSDYYLIDEKTNTHYLIELKIGGDLDNKKARSEKEAVLEQYCILSNTLPEETGIHLFFATAYNRFGEDNTWNQQRVRQFFAEEELLIGKDFWNFICRSEEGYGWVLDAYRTSASYIIEALDSIKDTYLGDHYE